MTCVKNIYIISNIAYNIPLKYKENFYEEDLSAQEKTEKQGSRLQKKNEHGKRQKGTAKKAQQRQKGIICIKHREGGCCKTVVKKDVSGSFAAVSFISLCCYKKNQQILKSEAAGFEKYGIS